LKKEKISVSIDAELMEWMDDQITKRRFSSRSHCILYCMDYVKNQEK